MAGLAARLLQPSLTQALCPAWSLAGAIARRRFAAIGAIQPKPTFQISYTRRQHRVLLLQRQIARLQLANKGKQCVHGQRGVGRRHPYLDSQMQVIRQDIRPVTWAVTLFVCRLIQQYMLKFEKPLERMP
jgi:hypothetical protein